LIRYNSKLFYSSSDPNIKGEFKQLLTSTVVDKEQDNNKYNSSSDLSNIQNNTNKYNYIGSYLAGLFELFSSDKLLENTKVNSIMKKSRDMKYITDGIDNIPFSTSEILIGLLLGDVHASKAITKNPRFMFAQGWDQRSHLYHLYEIFKDFCKTEPKIYRRIDKRTNKTYSTIQFSTLTSPLFNYYYNIFYVNGNKVIPANLGELLTARGLAYWAMDDGTKTGTGFRLSTQSFTKDEN